MCRFTKMQICDENESKGGNIKYVEENMLSAIRGSNFSDKRSGICC